MDLLEQLKSQLGDVLAAETAGAKGAQGPAHDPHTMLEAVLGMISQSGGLSGLLEKLKGKGLGEIAASWVGGGENQPVTGQQLAAAVGPEIAQIASKLGSSSDQAAQLLSKYLPLVIDHLTPGGKIEEGGLLAKGLEFLKSQLGGAAKSEA